MTRNIFIIIGLLIFNFVTAMTVKLVLSFSDLDGSQLFDLGIGSLNLKYTLNTGINFGLASQATDTRQMILAIVALLISLGVIIHALKQDKFSLSLVAGLLAGGGITNAYERLAYGGVFDYVNVSLNAYENPYAFNLADIYIFIGALLFIASKSARR